MVSIIYILSLVFKLVVVVTNTVPRLDKARRLSREYYSTCIVSTSSVGRRRIRVTSIICIHSLVFKLVVVVTNTVAQVDKARRLSRE